MKLVGRTPTEMHRRPSNTSLYDAVPILHINDISTVKGEGKINDNLALVVNGVFEYVGAALDAVEPPAGASKELTTRLCYNLDQLSAGKSIGKPKPATADS